MYTLIRTINSRRSAIAEGLSLTFSLLIAETFYKFHSFTLECVAFLATWYVLSRLFTAVEGRRV
jgi:hypothetical protein